jgi:leucyl-tRNA synthetase
MRIFLTLLAPFAPHICDESWEMLGFEGMATTQPWPSYDETKIKNETVEIAIQINGKFRGTVTVPAGSDQDATVRAVMENQKIQKVLQTGTVVKTIYVKDKLVNLIIR